MTGLSFFWLHTKLHNVQCTYSSMSSHIICLFKNLFLHSSSLLLLLLLADKVEEFRHFLAFFACTQTSNKACTPKSNCNEKLHHFFEVEKSNFNKNRLTIICNFLSLDFIAISFFSSKKNLIYYWLHSKLYSITNTNIHTSQTQNCLVVEFIRVQMSFLDLSKFSVRLITKLPFECRKKY